MKKTIKIISLCLCLTLFGVLFAGCDYLDDKKASHAILSDDRETISFNGKTYKKLPEGASIYYANFYSEKFGGISVTDEDVPVLLSHSYCHASQYDETRDIFCVYIRDEYDKTADDIFYTYSYAYVEDVTDSTFYCNEKDYDKYVGAIESSRLDKIGIEYECSDKDYNYYYNLDVAAENLSNEVSDCIKNPEKMTNDAFDEIVDRYDSECLQGCIYKCDSEGVLAEVLDGFDILRFDKEAYLVNYTTEVAFKLSEQAFDELEDKYFYGDYDYDIYQGDYTQNDALVGIIGSADGETEIVVGEANLFKSDF